MLSSCEFREILRTESHALLTDVDDIAFKCLPCSREGTYEAKSACTKLPCAPFTVLLGYAESFMEPFDTIITNMHLKSTWTSS